MPKGSLLGSLGPAFENIFLGAYVLRVPGLVFRVPQVVVVVVVAQHKEVLCPTTLIAFYQGLRVPLLGFE